MFYRAAEAGEHRLVTSLVKWLGDGFSQFAKSVDWKYAQRLFSIEMFTVLVKGDFLHEGLQLPLPEHKQAKDFQLALFGPKLSNSPFAKLSCAFDRTSIDVIAFVFGCAFGHAKGSFLNPISPEAQWRRPGEIANALVRSRPPSSQFSSVGIGTAFSARYNCSLGWSWTVIGAADDHIKVLGIRFITKTFNLPAKPFQPKSAQISA